MYSIKFKIQRQADTITNLKDFIVQIYQQEIKYIKLGNTKLKDLNHLSERPKLDEFDRNGNKYSDLIIEYNRSEHFNVMIKEEYIYSVSNLSINDYRPLIISFITKFKPLLFSYERNFQEFHICSYIVTSVKLEKYFRPYWIQLIDKDLFENINAITPVTKLFENENGVVMQLTEEPTSADNPEHLEKVIKIYEGLFPDFKADRTKLNELKAKQEASAIEDYKKTQPKSFLSKLFGK